MPPPPPLKLCDLSRNATKAIKNFIFSTSKPRYLFFCHSRNSVAELINGIFCEVTMALNDFISIYVLQDRIIRAFQNISGVDDWDIKKCHKTGHAHLHVSIILGDIRCSFVVSSHQQYRFLMDSVQDILQNRDDNSSCSSTS